jgi:hypothetical protein
VFTARYAPSPYIKQVCFVFKGLNVITRIERETIIMAWTYEINRQNMDTGKGTGIKI